MPWGESHDWDWPTYKVHDRQEKNTEFVWNKWPPSETFLFWEYRCGVGNGMLHYDDCCIELFPAFFARTGVIA